MSGADIVKSEYVLDPETGLLVKRGGNNTTDRHAMQ